MTSLMEHVVALTNSGLMTLRAPVGQRKASWRLNAPAEQLEETLKKTNTLIANALGGVEIDDDASYRE